MNDRPDEPDSKNGDREPRDFRSSESLDEASAKDGLELPEPPDLTLVHELRDRIRQDKAQHEPRRRHTHTHAGQRVRDIGTYTIIPMMMVVGPAVGYFLGWLIEKRWGGEPWPVVIGILFGLVAAFRQIFILLSRKQNSPR